MNSIQAVTDLSGERAFPDFKTEGIKYAGSKLRLLDHILYLASQVDAHRVFDGFSGTTRVSQAFAKCGYRVTSSDISVWSETFANCYLKAGSPDKYDKLIKHLRKL